MEKVKICPRLWPWVMNLWVSEKKKVEMASTLKTHKLKDRPLTLRPGSACVALNTLKVNYPCQQELGKSHRCLEHICHLLDREKNGKKPGQA